MKEKTIENNLSRTLELIDLCFRLKEAYLRSQHPGASAENIRALIYRGILARKEKQWTKELSKRPQDLMDIAALREALDDTSFKS